MGAPGRARHGRPGLRGVDAGGRGADVVAAGRERVEPGGRGRIRPVWRRRVVDGEDQGKQTGKPGQGRQRMKQWFPPKGIALPRVAVVAHDLFMVWLAWRSEERRVGSGSG